MNHEARDVCASVIQGLGVSWKRSAQGEMYEDNTPGCQEEASKKQRCPKSALLR